MESKAYYLQYRPQKISELDSIAIREGLEKVLKSLRIPHAFLFAGPKGIGKTSAARVLAKAVNCLNRGQGYEPCNKCDVCREITNGSSLDLIEIDAASNRGIDDIRNLREKIKLAPAKCKYKVYIIDEVHMLTPEAFNALLKTLEEPPEHAIFILCTTAPEKLPATIISRCMRFNFRKAQTEEIIRSLEKVVRGENLKVEEGVLKTIAKAADGSFRDAHKILEQLSFGGKAITLKETQRLLDQIEELKPDRLLNLLAEYNTKEALTEIDRVVNRGADLMIWTQGLLEQLRLALLAKAGVLMESELGDYFKKLDMPEMLCLIQIFARAASELKTSFIPQLPLELAVVEWVEQRKNSSDDGQDKQKLKVEKENPPSPTRPNPSGNNNNPTYGLLSGGKKLEEILQKWNDFLTSVRPLNHSAEILLKASRPVSLDGEILTIAVNYEFHKEKLEAEKCRGVAEEVAQQIFGIPIRLKCILSPRKTEETKRQNDGQNTKKGKDFDIIDVANEIFNGKIIS